MRTLKICASYVLLLAVLCHPALAQSDKATQLEEIIRKVDQLYRSDSSYAEMEMQIKTPNWERTLKMQAWSEGLDKTFITILSPKKDRGIATLRVGNEMWNYFPKIDKVMKVPPSMMMGSWMGSDFTNDDLVKESTLINDYDHELLDSPAGQEAYYYIQLKPKKTTVSLWGKILIIVEKKGLLPLKQEYFDEKGKKVRLMAFSDIGELGGRRIPTTLTMTPLTKKDHKTIIRYSKADFKIKVNRDRFSLRNLKRRR